ncbi:Uncharacterised protein [Chlamydia abortus]|nr:Uncharacterised protein [Chlamydia abortus]
METDQAVRDCLLNLIAGLEEWGKELGEPPALLRNGHMQFVRLLMLEGKEAPIDLHSLIRLLQKQWMIHFSHVNRQEELGSVSNFHL